MFSFLFDALEPLVGFTTGAPLEFRTDLPPSDAIRALSREVRPPTSIGQRLPPIRVNKSAKFTRPIGRDAPEMPLMGWVDDPQVTVWLRTRDPELYASSNSAARMETWTSSYPVFRGRLEETDHGSVLRGRPTLPRPTAAFAAFWLGANLAMAWIFWMWTPPSWAAFPLLLMVVGIILFRIAANKGERELQILRKTLQAAVDDASDPRPDSSDVAVDP